jgi:outer membrane protein assembly factor BamB
MHRTFSIRVFGVVAAIALNALDPGPVRAEHWPGWRGPRGDGTSHEEGIPVRWSAG